MKKVAMFLFLAVLFFVGYTTHAQSQVIKGTEHPEMISDSQAYGLVLTHYSEILANPKISDVQKLRLFQMMNLSVKDEAKFRDILLDHKARRDAQLALFNKKATDLYLDGESIPSFSQIHQSVISETRGKLSALLSVDGLKKLDAFVQNQKSRMIVPVTE